MRMRFTLFTQLVLALCSATAYGLPTYNLIDLGTLGGSWSEAYGINDAGQLA